jgi:hypothetical protein
MISGVVDISPSADLRNPVALRTPLSDNRRRLARVTRVMASSSEAELSNAQHKRTATSAYICLYIANAFLHPRPVGLANVDACSDVGGALCVGMARWLRLFGSLSFQEWETQQEETLVLFAGTPDEDGSAVPSTGIPPGFEVGRRFSISSARQPLS